MPRHHAPFKSKYDIREFENKCSNARKKRPISKIRDAIPNKKLFDFDEEKKNEPGVEENIEPII